jgi:manganese transport protein
MAGQMIMQGFVRFRIPLLVRRLVTMVPAFAVVLMGIDSTKALIASQVILSITLPIPMLALLHFTSKRTIMGDYVNGTLVKVLGSLGAAVVLCLNFLLLAQVVGLY